MTDSERQQILKMIEDGKISPEQGLTLMQALEEAPDDGLEDAAAEAQIASPALSAADASAIPEAPALTTAGSTGQPGGETSAEHRSDPEFERKVNRFRSLWVVPLWVGIGITVVGAYWMYAALQSSGLGFWFFLAWFPFLLGVLLTVLAFSSRTSRWIYINITQAPGESPRHIVLAFPLSLVSWGLQFARFGSLGRGNGARDDVMQAIFQGTRSDGPLFVDVHDEDGEHVQVYIG